MFGHGLFMKAVRWLIVCPPPAIDTEAMHAYRAFGREHPVENGGGFTAVWDGCGWRVV
jgi:hypothetical protein